MGAAGLCSDLLLIGFVLIMIMLTGAELKLPDGYQCHVVQKQQPQQQQQPQSGSLAQVPWTSTAQAANITHWKHDLLPSKTDDLPRCCEWLMLSDEVRDAAVGRLHSAMGWKDAVLVVQLHDVHVPVCGRYLALLSLAWGVPESCLPVAACNMIMSR